MSDTNNELGGVESLGDEVMANLLAAMQPALDAALAKMLADPRNKLNPEATRTDVVSLFAEAAFRIASALDGEAGARSAFELLAMPPDAEFDIAIETPSAVEQRRTARRKMQKASRKAKKRR